jgi:PilZ domain
MQLGNTNMHIAARLAIHSLAPNRRRHSRIVVESQALISGCGFDGADVVVQDISENGFSARAGHHLPPGTIVRLKVPGFGMAIGKIVWSKRGELGGEFINPVSYNRLRSIVGYKPMMQDCVAA